MKKEEKGKLVRDKIPEIIHAKGEALSIKILGDEEYREALSLKLHEEVREFLLEKNKEEMADVLEVLHAFADMYNFSWEEVEEMRLKKQGERGAFRNKVFLYS